MQDRDAAIVAAYATGASVKDTARALGISRARVYQIYSRWAEEGRRRTAYEAASPGFLDLPARARMVLERHFGRTPTRAEVSGLDFETIRTFGREPNVGWKTLTAISLWAHGKPLAAPVSVVRKFSWQVQSAAARRIGATYLGIPEHYDIRPRLVSQALKSYTCDACLADIPKGAQYMRAVYALSFSDGKARGAYDARLCMGCVLQHVPGKEA